VERNRVLVPLTGVECGAKTFPMIKRFLEPERTELIILEVSQFPEEVSALHETERIARGNETAVIRGSTEQWPTGPYPGSEAEPQVNRDMVEEGAEAGRTEESKRQERAAKYRPLLDELSKAGYVVSVKIRFGDDPARRICKAAQVERVDLIGMATHGRSGLSRFFAGSIAETVLRESGVPVLLAKIE
jgi:nucleotide-binding universal stress UspA family protein